MKVKDWLEDFWLLTDSRCQIHKIDLNFVCVDKFIAGNEFSWNLSKPISNEKSKSYPRKCELCSPDVFPMKTFVIILHTLLYQEWGCLSMM